MVRRWRKTSVGASSLALAVAWGAVVCVGVGAGCRNVPFYRMTSKASKSLPLRRAGIVAFARGDLLLAEENLRTAVELNDSDVETCRYYAETLWRLGKRDDAIAVLEAAAEKRATLDVEESLYRSLGEKALERNRPE
ncbi:MAG: tetratricopeptide repeat protein, partial [Thermoguttaceae bacterium]|nr:tetratricopeptide repeat protein [Thermoguttaceae bacterium]